MKRNKLDQEVTPKIDKLLTLLSEKLKDRKKTTLSQKPVSRKIRSRAASSNSDILTNFSKTLSP